MAHPTHRPALPRLPSPGRWLPTLVACLSWGAVIVLVVAALGPRRGAAPALAGAAALALNLAARAWADGRRGARPIRRLVGRLVALADRPQEALEPAPVPELDELHRAVRALRKAWLSVPPPPQAPPSYNLAMD